MEAVENARILIIDDEAANVQLLQRILQRKGYNDLCSTTDPRQALSLFEECAPDLVVLDLHMPHMDGFAVMEQLEQSSRRNGFVPILVLTADVTEATKQRALSGGANDFLTKPFSVTEAVLRIRNLLEIRRLNRSLARHNEELEERVRQRSRELEDARMEILERLTFAVEFRDDDTGHHTRRVGENSAIIARALGLPEEEAELIRRAAPLHDVGKVAIPDSILLKPGRLTPEELAIMQTHTTAGARILSGGRVPLIQTAEVIALAHHERWDGKGYPNRQAEEEIPLAARIVAVADVYDALAHDRPYRPAWPLDKVREHLREGAGSHFDPRAVEAFLDTLG